MRLAGEHGAKQVYVCTDHVGLYEKYGYAYVENRVSIYGEDSRVLVRRTLRPQPRVEPLMPESFRRDSLDGFIRRQEVHQCWRETAQGWQLQPVGFTEDWDGNRLRQEAEELLALHGAGHAVFLARAGEAVIGYASLGGRLGSRGQYVELLGFQVSAPWRGCGVGRMLFRTACEAAMVQGAQRLYISAHSSEESQAAYRALGCVHARERDPARTAAEPDDVQMEYDLQQLMDKGHDGKGRV